MPAAASRPGRPCSARRLYPLSASILTKARGLEGDDDGAAEAVLDGLPPLPRRQRPPARTPRSTNWLARCPARTGPPWIPPQPKGRIRRSETSWPPVRYTGRTGTAWETTPHRIGASTPNSPPRSGRARAGARAYGGSGPSLLVPQLASGPWARPNGSGDGHGLTPPAACSVRWRQPLGGG